MQDVSDLKQVSQLGLRNFQISFRNSDSTNVTIHTSCSVTQN